MLVAPERRMSSWVITWMAEGEVKSGSERRAVEVTSRFINSSRLKRFKSDGLPAKSLSTAAAWVIEAIAISTKSGAWNNPSELVFVGRERAAFIELVASHRRR